jgi:hypothetical protein
MTAIIGPMVAPSSVQTHHKTYLSELGVCAFASCADIVRYDFVQVVKFGKLHKPRKLNV